MFTSLRGLLYATPSSDDSIIVDTIVKDEKRDGAVAALSLRCDSLRNRSAACNASVYTLYIRIELLLIIAFDVGPHEAMATVPVSPSQSHKEL